MKVIANMVVRNEADAYLPRVLERLQNQVDLICVTDDASDDNTVEVARSFGAKVYQMTEPTFRVNEGVLRQVSWNWLQQHVTPDEDVLVVAIDADEELYELGPSLYDLAKLSQYSVFNVTFYHMWNETQYRADGGWTPHPSSRVFRYKPGGFFNQRKLACGSEPTYVNGDIRSSRYLRNTGLAMKHLSYIKDEDKQKKYERYTELDGGAFHAGAHIRSIIDPIEEVKLQTWRWDS